MIFDTSLWSQFELLEGRCVIPRIYIPTSAQVEDREDIDIRYPCSKEIALTPFQAPFIIHEGGLIYCEIDIIYCINFSQTFPDIF